MKSQLAQYWALPPTWLRSLIIILLVLGIFFRFVNLDRKIYWMDEVYTSLRISGYTESEVAYQLLEGHIIRLQELHKYQRINSKNSVVNTVNGLATEEPHLSPLYFILVRFWTEIFGDSVAAVRSFSAFLSLLAFPCIYWLCLELFESSLVGWLACALLAVSPFQLVYAQEARQYSLWTVAILLSSASLLGARRVNTWRSWGIYALTVTLGFYSHLFFVLVATAQAIYVFVINNCHWSKTLRAYCLSSLVAIIAFSPWIVVIITNYQQALTMTAAQDTKIPLIYFLKSWLGNLSRNFIDTGFSSTSPFGEPWYSLVLPSLSILVITTLVAYSIFFLVRHTPKRTFMFILILISFTSFALIIPDLISGRRTSVTGRYMIPSYLGIQLAVSYLLGSKVNPALLSISNRFNHFWKLTLLALLISSVISCVVVSQSKTWWNNLTDTHNLQMAQIINQTSNSLVIQEIASSPPRYNVFNLISLSYLLKPDIKFKFIPKYTVPEVPKMFEHVFFMAPSTALRSGIEKKYRSKIEPIEANQATSLWKLVKS